MGERVRVTTPRGLRLRNSPGDGAVTRVLSTGEELEVLGRETWLRVRSTSDSSVGFVLADYVEPADGAPAEITLAEAPAEATHEDVEEIVVCKSTLFEGRPLRVNRGFLPAAREVERIANESGVRLYINSGLRDPQLPITGAIVKPADRSNHYVGHALDMNILLGGETLGSDTLGDVHSLPPQAQAFIQAIRTHPVLRWGGDFATPDPVHIDDALNIRRPQEYADKLRSIWRR